MSLLSSRTTKVALSIIAISASGFASAGTTYSPALKNGFPIKSNTVDQFCKEKNSTWVNNTLNATSYTSSQSVAKRISNTWVLSFPNEGNTKATSVTCAASTTADVNNPYRLGYPILGIDMAGWQGDQICSEEGYGSYVSHTTTPNFNSKLSYYYYTTSWVANGSASDYEYAPKLTKVVCNVN